MIVFFVQLNIVKNAMMINCINKSRCYAHCIGLNDKENKKCYRKNENSKKLHLIYCKNSVDCTNDSNTCKNCSESFTLKNIECAPTEDDLSSE